MPMSSANKKKVAIVSLICLLGVSTLGYGWYDAWNHPAREIEGVWDAKIYYKTANGENLLLSRLEVARRQLNFYGIIKDENSRSITTRRVTMTLSHKRGKKNIYTTNMVYDNPTSNWNKNNLKENNNQQFIFSVSQPKLYLLDCNNLVIDLEPGNDIGFTAIYKRRHAQNC